MTTMTIEQLQAQAEAAAQALREAKEEMERAAVEAAQTEAAAKERARREALRDAPEPAAYAERRKHLHEIINAACVAVQKDGTLKDVFGAYVTLPKKTVTETPEGPKVHWAEPQVEFTHRGKSVWAQLEFRAEEAASSRYSTRAPRLTGRLRCTVGGYGERQSFPQRKDGTFNYEAIAAKLLERVYHEERKYQDALKLRANAGALEALSKEFALGETPEVLKTAYHSRGYSGKEWHTHTAPEGKLFLNLTTTVTPEQARAVLAAAQAAGIKLV